MKKNSLLTADLHLTDVPSESYRWGIFDLLQRTAIERQVDEIYILGDAFDRKDRHSGTLVNCFIREAETLKAETGAEVIFLMGNHDAPINGIPYWSFLSSIGVKYIVQPTLHRKTVWLMPFCKDPQSEWNDINFTEGKALFMHQTLPGCKIEGERVLTSGQTLPPLPRGNFHIFSGDVHRPQKVGRVTYIGGAYPVRFGEVWRNRILFIEDDNFAQPVEIFVNGLQRKILDISSTTALEVAKLRKGDQVRVRYHLSHEQMTQWPVEQEIIRSWATKNEYYLMSLEAVLVDNLKPVDGEVIGDLALLKPDEVVRSFGADEHLDPEIVKLGLQFLAAAGGN